MTSKVFASGKTVSYNIFTDVDNEKDKFAVLISFDSDINILTIGHSTSSIIARNDFNDEDTVKEIVKFLNAGHDYFEIDGEEYWVKDNRNLNLERWEDQYTTPAKFKLVKITREYSETRTIEDVKL